MSSNRWQRPPTSSRRTCRDLAFHRALASVEIHVFEGGQQLLETHHAECEELVARFVDDAEAGRV
jgi:hypothetical protein